MTPESSGKDPRSDRIEAFIAKQQAKLEAEWKTTADALMAWWQDNVPQSYAEVQQRLQHPAALPADVLATLPAELQGYLADPKGAWQRYRIGQPPGFNALNQLISVLERRVPALAAEREKVLDEMVELMGNIPPLSPEEQAEIDAMVADECGITVEELHARRESGGQNDTKP